MKNNYNLSSKSDMKQYTKDLEQKIKDIAVDEAMGSSYEVTCPACGETIEIPVGKSACPKCGEEIDLQLDIKF